MASAITHYQALALHKTRRRSLRRLVKKHDPKCPRNQVLTAPLTPHPAAQSLASAVHHFPPYTHVSYWDQTVHFLHAMTAMSRDLQDPPPHCA